MNKFKFVVKLQSFCDDITFVATSANTEDQFYRYGSRRSQYDNAFFGRDKSKFITSLVRSINNEKKNGTPLESVVYETIQNGQLKSFDLTDYFNSLDEVNTNYIKDYLK